MELLPTLLQKTPECCSTMWPLLLTMKCQVYQGSVYPQLHNVVQYLFFCSGMHMIVCSFFHKDYVFFVMVLVIMPGLILRILLV